MDGCQLWKVDLVAQVKQLQEKLNHLVYSMVFQNVDAEAFKLQQMLTVTCAPEDGLGGDSHSPEETDRLLPVDTLDFDKNTWDLVDVTKDEDSWVANEMPNGSIREKLDSQDGSLGFQTSTYSDSHAPTLVEEVKPLTETSGTLDLSSWSSPEVLRKDSALEAQLHLPLTPCSGTLSLCGADASLLPGLLSPPGELAGQPLRWVESPLADQSPVQRMAVVGASTPL